MPGAMRGSVAHRAETFNADLKALQGKYPAVDEEVQNLEEFLKLDYVVPEIRVDPESAPNVYSIKLDYRLLGAAGRSRFLVIYHATDPEPSPQTPYRTFTMLTITERK